MGTDIRWIIERRHEDGAWEAVASGARLHSLLGQARYSLERDDPRVFFGERDYGWFGLLSGVRGRYTGQRGEIATPGLPEDASEHSRREIGVEEAYTTGSHSQGYFTLGHLRKVVQEPDHSILSTREACDLAGLYLECLEHLISGRYAIDMETLLRGDAVDPETGEDFPALRQESNHERLARLARQKTLEPISGDTLRVLVAYGS